MFLSYIHYHNFRKRTSKTAFKRNTDLRLAACGLFSLEQQFNLTGVGPVTIWDPGAYKPPKPL